MSDEHENPFDVYRGRPVGQTISGVAFGENELGYDVSVSFTLECPDNLHVEEEHVSMILHAAYHAITIREPSVLDVDIEGESLPEDECEDVAQAVRDELAELIREEIAESVAMSKALRPPEGTDPTLN